MTIAKKECVVVASVLMDDGKPGPNICTALAYAPTYWESPEAGKLAEAIVKVVGRGFRPSATMVKAMLEECYKPWIDHPTFKDGLPLSCAESVAAELLPVYRRRRIAAAIADAYQAVIEHPESTVKVARALVVTLGDLA